MPRRAGLGRGLDALIPGNERESPGGAFMIEVAKITANPRQPRSQIDPEDLNDLEKSIREYGIIQPLIVTEDPNQPGQYVLIAGERRLLAARQAGLTAVPAVIREATDEQRLELALIENIQRADLGPLETAEAFRQLAEDFNLSHEEIAGRVFKNRTTVTNTLRLLKLPVEVQSALTEKKISEGHARALLALSTPQAQNAALNTILTHDLNVRQTEELVKQLNGARLARPEKPGLSPELSSVEERLRNRLGTRVNLNHHSKGGTIVIHYYSDEELTALVDHLMGNE
jgi:ParB family transcriptional regulator, chromosome partitioning protein